MQKHPSYPGMLLHINFFMKNKLKSIFNVIIKLIVLGAGSFFANEKVAFGQNESDPKDTIVTRLPFISQIAYPQPKEFLYAGKRKRDEFPGSLYPKFFPIGWSKDGKFAYVEEPADEACGCYFFTIYIQDLYSDTMAWQWKFEGNPDDGMNLKKIWNKFGTLFTGELNKYQIFPLSFDKLEKLPFLLNGIKYSFLINNSPFFDNDSKKTRIAATTITMKVNGLARKKVFKKIYTYKGSESPPATYSTTLSNKILGYLKSPYENKIALFYMVENRGWEGPPNVMEFQLVGCDLRNAGLH
jgi:hypothetical protein